jgi:hypothetical protein
MQCRVPQARRSSSLASAQSPISSQTYIPGRGLRPDEGAGKRPMKFDWAVGPVLLVTPVLALYGLIAVTPHPATVILMLSLYALFGLGITMGYHRLWSHRSFDAHPLVRAALLVCGAGAMEGSCRWYVLLSSAANVPCTSSIQCTRRTFAYTHTHSLTHSLTHSVTHSHTHSLTHSLTHSHTHSLTHSLTHSHSHTIAAFIAKLCDQVVPQSSGPPPLHRHTSRPLQRAQVLLLGTHGLDAVEAATRRRREG